jgi:ATP-dependent protease Clp ATPase subunit
MYEIPSHDNISKCIVDENVILNRTRPLLVTIGGQEIPYAESA